MSSSGTDSGPLLWLSDPRLSIDLGFSPEVLFALFLYEFVSWDGYCAQHQAFCSNCVFEDERVLTGWTQDTSCQTYRNVWVPVLT